MGNPLASNTLVVKEHVGMFKAASNYDIYDATSGEQVLTCRENSLGVITKILRFTDYKRNTPFNIELRDPSGNLIVRVKRGVSLIRSNVEVYDGLEHKIGGFKQKLLSIGGAFDVLNAEGATICTLKGKWTGWDFKFMRGDEELAHVAKKWNGLGKEMFTSADNYALSVSESLSDDAVERKLIVAAVMCIDLVLKE